jgi:hypothetical protein
MRRYGKTQEEGGAPPNRAEEQTDEPHPYSKHWHVRIVDVGNRSSDLWIWTIFLLKRTEVEFHPAERVSKGGMKMW